MLRPLGATDWIFLRYFVVDAAQRRRGLGRVPWKKVTGRLYESGYSPLVFDVEDPEEPGCGQQESQTRSRHIAFYQRQGVSLRPVSGYRTPHGNAQ